MAGRNETAFMNEFLKAIEFYFPGSFFHHMHDAPRKNISKKPYDIYGFYNKQGYAFELKCHTVNTGWALDKLKSHQYEALKKSANNGAKTFILINVHYGDEDFIRVLTLGEYEHYKDTHQKSIAFDELKKRFCLYRNEKDKYHWNVRPIINY